MFTKLGDVRFKVAGYLIKGSILPDTVDDTRLALKFAYHVPLLSEVKSMDGAKWHGFDKKNPRKIWTIPNSPRNAFRLDFLTGGNPYAQYDNPLIPYQSKRTAPAPYAHQLELTSFFIARRHCIAAAEMGTGKTLASIEAIEYAGYPEVWWIGPKSALASVELEFYKWRAKIWPRFMTYERLVKEMENWTPGKPAPRFVVFDECSRLRNPNSQRGMAGKALADAIRAEYGYNSYIIMLSGSPAPKDPTNWWHQCEVACPGFLKEGNIHKFKNRLGLIQSKLGFDGGTYPKLITWWDDANKCKTCGQVKDHEGHDPINMLEGDYHEWQASTNEVNLLYERMRGLVMVKLKKDCLDLPEKIYEVIQCEPTPSILRAAQLITASAATTIQALTLQRELSDGFQYQDEKSGETDCGTCKGSKEQDEYFDTEKPDEVLDKAVLNHFWYGSDMTPYAARLLYNDDGIQIGIDTDNPIILGKRKTECTHCNGTGLVPTYTRTTVEVECPKDEVVFDLLDQYEEEGRMILWGGFTGSIDRLVKLVLKRKWTPIRVDGRGWWSTIPGSTLDLLRMFDNKADFDKIAFIGQPGAGGMGLNLTASSVEVYYSNTFNAEDRWQSEDRFHRPGADHNRGCKIIDIVHLPTDLLVMNNLKVKRDLQSMSMGLFQEELRKIKIETPRRV